MTPQSLVEREPLIQHLVDAGRVGGRMLLVGGEAGIGKTSLVQAFAARVGGRVLVGACEHLATAAVLGPLEEISAEVGGPLAAAIDAGRHPRDVGLALLRELRGQTVVLLEDIHWADEATLDVLRVVARRIGSTPSLVVVTYRDDDLLHGNRLRLLLGDLTSFAAVERVTVPPLSLDAVIELADARGADGTAVHGLTQGNPFFVTELLASDHETLPTSVRDAVLARNAQLSEGARSLLEGVALVPKRAELWLLEAAFSDLADHVDECVTTGVLQEARGSVAFRHELARRAVEGTVPPRRARSFHRSILAALEAPPDGRLDSGRLAHHAEGAGDILAVIRHGRTAAEHGSRAGAHGEAAAHYARVLAHADRLAPVERANVLAAHAVEAQASGAYEQAVVSLQRATAIRRERGDDLQAGDHLARLTAPHVILGQTAEAEATAADAVATLERLPESPELATAYAFQAYVRMIQRDNDLAVNWAEKAIELARRFDDPDTLAFGLNVTGTAHIMAGRTDLGIGFLEESLEVANAHELEHRVALAHWMLGSGLGEMMELERAERSLRDHIAVADDHDLDSAYTRAWLGAVLVYRGRWDEGVALAAEMLAGDTAPTVRITACVALGRVRARRGDPGADAVLDDALALALPGGSLQRLGHVYAARAEAAWLVGDHGRAIDEARAVYPLALEKHHLWYAGELAYWQWKCGALDQVPSWIADPYRLQIEGHATEAAALWNARGCPYEAARALAESATGTDVTAVLAELEALDARPAAEQARARLRSLGLPIPRGPRAATRSNPAELTERELEVLRLVAEGLRNAEVADRLVISRRTVDHHVAAILRKLRAKSRGQAVAEAARLDLLEHR